MKKRLKMLANIFSSTWLCFREAQWFKFIQRKVLYYLFILLDEICFIVILKVKI